MLRGKVYATLIIGIAFFMFGGVSQAAGENLVVEVEFMEVTEFEFIEITEPEFIEITKFEFTEASEPEFSERFIDVDGSTKFGGKQKSVEQIMCGPSNGLPAPKECLFEGQ